MSKVKILLSYHKPDYLFKDEILTPIHAGRDNALKRMGSDDPKLRWLLENTMGDNSGENISNKNSIYNEMTTVYWAWKNYEKLGNPEYIGFMHYRRHFIFKDMPHAVYDCLDIDDNYYDTINYSLAVVEEAVEKYDFICTKPHYRTSMYEHYKNNHDVKDLDCTIEILKEKYPNFEPYAKKYLEGHEAYFCNMFIFSRKDFFEYAEWFFNITFELEKRIDLTGKRLFVSEWLTGIFITYLLSKGLRGKFYATMIAEGDHTIPVVLAADDNYAVPMCVTLVSILENAKKKTFYDFYILKSGDFEKEKEDFILKLMKKYERCNIYFIDMKNQYQDIDMQINHITAATFYRLQLPTLLKNVSKCIYLDVDLVVIDDLSELYRTSVDDRYVAGIRAPGYYYPEDHRRRQEKEKGIVMDDYINAGVLLINLEKMRRDNLEERFNSLLEKNFSSQDQDIINVACFGKIRHLQFKYNVMTKYNLMCDSEYDRNPGIQECFSREEWDYGIKHPSIIHYADRIKPWENLSAYYSKEWWKYAFRAGVSEELLVPYLENVCDSAIEMRNTINLVNAHKRDLRYQLECVHNSASFKIGRKITFLPRKIRGGIQCIKDHGFLYTWKHALKKIWGR